MRSSSPRRTLSFDRVEDRQGVACLASAKGGHGGRQGCTAARAVKEGSARFVAVVLGLHHGDASGRHRLCGPRLRAVRAGIIPASGAAEGEDQCLNDGKKGRWEQQNEPSWNARWLRCMYGK
jgi:hypothetical protein